jgi:hypothetical protein
VGNTGLGNRDRLEHTSWIKLPVPLLQGVSDNMIKRAGKNYNIKRDMMARRSGNLVARKFASDGVTAPSSAVCT